MGKMEFTEEYSETEWIKIRSEFTRIKDNHYLDHAGATLYSEKQLTDCTTHLTENLFCNPHTSKTTEDLIDQVRFRILQHFNTDDSKYCVIFTSGTTASLKVVGETFNFGDAAESVHSKFVYLRDSHTSVLGMREIVNTKNIEHVERNDLLLNVGRDNGFKNQKSGNSNSLIVFPAQCNFNGNKYPLEIIKNIQTNGLISDTENQSNWYVCLDAASYVSTNYLDLQKYNPDYVCISFYKIFGYPTGLGALIVSRRGEEMLKKRYYGGGTVKIAMSGKNWHRKRDCFYERFEDGTIPFLSIISLLEGCNTLQRLIPGINTMERISKHCYNLAKYLFDKLSQMKHMNSKPVIKFYHDTHFESRDNQGAIVNFNVLHDDGSYVGFAEFACMASLHNIFLRTGCFCNPGACQRLLHLSDDDVQKHFQAGHICGDSNDLIDGVPTGSVRISLGYMTEKKNVDHLLHMIEKCYIQRRTDITIDRNIIQKYYKKTGNTLIIEGNGCSYLALKEICVFPIKSCGPFKVTSKWSLTARGLKYDREWMIVNANGVALTQKGEPKMCMIKPTIAEDKKQLILEFPYRENISIPLDYDENHENSRISSLCQTKVCGDRIEGYDCGNEIAEWLTDALNIPGLRLIRQSNDMKRIFKNMKKAAEEPNLKEIALSNQAQFLLINKTSVDWLANKVEDWADTEDNPDLIVDRFRGNLIIETPTPFDEIRWSEFHIGNVKFNIDGQCTRCQMICIDQQTGEKTIEPLRTIAREFKGKMKFGIYLSQTEPLGLDNYISCSDKIKVLVKD